jgi:sugar/nucleoside kinase (ribokinase family)
VFGNANLEVTVQVGGFPITYAPNRTLQDGIHPGVSGTAYNVGTALAALDNDVTLCVTVGRDLVGGLVAEQLASQARVRLVPARVEQQPVTDVLFLSRERLPSPAEQFLVQLMRRCSRCQVAVVGCGAGGAMMALRGEPQVEHIPAVSVGRVVSTVGAGDALVAAFLDGYQRRLPARAALERATHFAAATLAHPGGAGGFLTAAQLHQRFPTGGELG